MDISPLLVRDKDFKTKLRQHLEEGKLFYSYTCDGLFGTYGSTTSLNVTDSSEMVEQFFSKVISMQEILAGVNEAKKVTHRIYQKEKTAERLKKYFQLFIDARQKLADLRGEDLRLLETEEVNFEDESCTTQGKSAEERIWIFKKKVDTYESEGLVIRGIDECNKMLSLNPNLYLAWYKKGRLHQKAREIARSLCCYDQCIKIDPRATDPYHQKALIFTSQMRFSDAISMYDKILGIDANNFEAIIGKARCLYKLNKPYGEWISRAKKISKKRTEELMKEYGIERAII